MKRIKNKAISAGFSLLLLSGASLAYEPEIEEYKLKEFQESAIQEGYLGVDFSGFRDGDDRTYTVKRHGGGAQDKTAMYTAELNDRADGNVYVSFRMRDNCSITYPKNPNLEKVFEINGTRVNMQYACMSSSEEEQELFSDTVALFWPISSAGKTFVKDQFIKNNWVFLNYGGANIPFSASGFTRLYAKFSKSAL